MPEFKYLNAEENLKKSTTWDGFEPMTAQLEHSQSKKIGARSTEKEPKQDQETSTPNTGNPRMEGESSE